MLIVFYQQKKKKKKLFYHQITQKPCVIGEAKSKFFATTVNWYMKRIKYEIRFGKPNGSMSMGQKKDESILCVESLTKRRPGLVHHVSDS